MNDQRSLEDQLKALGKLAIEARLYDADDFLIILRREVAALRAEARSLHDLYERSKADVENLRVQYDEQKAIVGRVREALSGQDEDLYDKIQAIVGEG